MEDKVKVVNLVSSRVNINIPELTLRRVWERKGSVKTIPFSQLEEAMYNPGVEALFTQGILGIESMEVKRALGLEPEDAEAPVNIIVLNEAQMKRYLTVMPFRDFKENLEKVSQEQLMLLVQYAIDNKIMADIEKVNYLREKTSISILKAIEENQRDAVKKEV